jgi:hypothetical protein
MGNYDKKLETYYYQKKKTTNIFIVNSEFIEFFLYNGPDENRT